MKKFTIPNDCAHCQEECVQSHLCMRHTSNHEESKDEFARIVMLMPKKTGTLCQSFWPIKEYKR